MIGIFNPCHIFFNVIDFCRLDRENIVTIIRSGLGSFLLSN